MQMLFVSDILSRGLRSITLAYHSITFKSVIEYEACNEVPDSLISTHGYYPNIHLVCSKFQNIGR